jgi:hypothetical protein
MQTYRRDTLGHLAKGQWKGCSSEHEARRKAEAAVATRRVVGAVALSQQTSGEYEDGETPITIAAFGDVPPEAKVELPF